MKKEKMNKTTEALKLAEEALEELHYSSGTVKAVTLYKSALAAIREALAEPVKQEPVAVKCGCREGCQYCQGSGWILANAAPVSAKREWVELTDDEVDKLLDRAWDVRLPLPEFARTVITAFKEKNK